MKKITKKVIYFSTALILTISYTNCSGPKMASVPSLPAGSVTNTHHTTPLPITGSEPNVLPVVLNYGYGSGYINEPTVNVTVCAPGTNNCKTISNVLVDTGSYGLRIFSSLVTGLNLTQEVDNKGNSVAECVTYADTSTEWGAVAKADIVLGSEKAPNVPIQLIDYTFGAIPTSCNSPPPSLGPDKSPANVGYNGIIGIGQKVADCSGCAVATNQVYFNCSSSSTNCNSTNITLATTYQVSNPIAFLPSDNNGAILQLPDVTDIGAVSASGYMVLGIGTQTDNTPGSSVLAYSGTQFITTFQGSNYPAFFDSGSDGLYFNGLSSLPACSSSTSGYGFYCPSSTQSFSAVIMSSSSTNAVTIAFKIMNGDVATSSNNPNSVFNDVGGPDPNALSGSFDWGLPFFLGRTVYVGITGKSSILGAGPYWAF